MGAHLFLEGLPRAGLPGTTPVGGLGRALGAPTRSDGVLGREGGPRRARDGGGCAVSRGPSVPRAGPNNVSVRTPSGVRRLRQSQRRALRNQRRLSESKTRVRRVLEELENWKYTPPREAHDLVPMARLLAAAYKALDKAAKHKVIHKNTAARRKSALAVARQRLLDAYGLSKMAHRACVEREVTVKQGPNREARRREKREAWAHAHAGDGAAAEGRDRGQDESSSESSDGAADAVSVVSDDDSDLEELLSDEGANEARGDGDGSGDDDGESDSDIDDDRGSDGDRSAPSLADLIIDIEAEEGEAAPANALPAPEGADAEGEVDP